MRTRHDWNAIQLDYDATLDPALCRARFRVTCSAWAMAVRRGKLRVNAAGDGRRRHNWRQVQAYYDEGNSLSKCMVSFKFCRAAWHKAVLRGEIKPRPLGRPLDAVLAAGGSRRNVKLRLLRAGLLQNRCLQCGLSEWLGKPLAIQIDHINGVPSDHRLENLRMLCPNCHSQTETYGRRNGKRPRLHEGTQPV